VTAAGHQRTLSGGYAESANVSFDYVKETGKIDIAAAA
jgi:hypothetical protein